MHRRWSARRALASIVLLLGAPLPGTAADPISTFVGSGAAAKESSIGPSGVPPQLAITHPDSAELRGSARAAQAAFERTRMRASPLTHQTFGGRCDETIGRLCIRLGSEDAPEWIPPPEGPEIAAAREDLLATLEEVADSIPGDGWVLGQRVVYLVEAGRSDEGMALVRTCPLGPEHEWWCAALLGTAAHYAGETLLAELAFDDALAAAPPEVAREWRDLSPVLDADLQGLVGGARGDSLEALERRVWALADPLYLVPGNDRRTEHFARHTLAAARADARNAYSMGWGRDLAETLVRYGPEVAYQRGPDPPLALGPPPVYGRFDPMGRAFLPTRAQLLAPSSVLPGEWRPDLRRARSRYAPGYAPRILPLDVRETRFPRGDGVLLVMAFRPGGDDPVGSTPPPSRADSLEMGLFVLTEPELQAVRLPGASFVAEVDRGPSDVGNRADVGNGAEVAIGADAATGVAVGFVPYGDHLLSLELLDREGKRAWRARHGVVREPPGRGRVVLSGLLPLRPGSSTHAPGIEGPSVAPGIEGPSTPPGFGATSAESGLGASSTAPDRLESHLDRALPPGPIERGPVELAWEVHGIASGDIVTFRLVASPVGAGALARLGRFLRLLPEPTTLAVTWRETPDRAPADDPDRPIFRRTTVDLSGLPAGPVRLVLTAELPGRTEARSEVLLELAPGAPVR